MIIEMRERLGFEQCHDGLRHDRNLRCRLLHPAWRSRRAGGIDIGPCCSRAWSYASSTTKARRSPFGTEGELLVRGFQVTPGYLDDPEQTAEAIDGDGWLHTGDIAVMDDAGYIDITDRKKDMFIMGGFNAYPAEIERVMVEHPRVGIVAVIGVPDERMGEVGAAFIVASPEGDPDTEELIAWCRERMANYKVPRHCWVVDELPLTASNKVRKPELRDLAVAHLGSNGSNNA